MLRYAIIAALALVAGSDGAAVQEPVGGRFAEQLDVRLVHVDVHVRRRGKPVADLRAEDFVLLEDGRQVEIAVFSPPDRTEATETPWERPGEPVVADAIGRPEVARIPSSRAERSTVALLVDDFGLAPGQRLRALRTAEVLSDPSNPNSDRLVVFRHLQRGRLTLQLPGQYAADPVDYKKMKRGAAVREQQALYFAMREIQSIISFAGCSRPQLLAVAEEYAATASASTDMRARLLGDAINHLGVLPGRKVLIVIMGRLELQPGVAILEHIMDLCPSLSSTLSARITGAASVANELHRVAGLANSHRVTLVGVDARGISAPSRADASLDSPRFGGSQLNQMIMDANLQSGLTQLASETGGSTIFNANNVAKPVLASLGESEAVYTLAFYPPHERTGRRHILKVHLVGNAKRGTRLRYRRSYMDRTMRQEWADSLRTLARAPDLRPDSSLPNPLGARLDVNATEDGLTVGLRLGSEAVATLRRLSPQSDRRLRLWLYVVDPEGRETDAREGFLSGPTESGPWQANVQLSLPSGDWTVAAGLRDEVTGEVSMLRHVPLPNG